MNRTDFCTLIGTYKEKSGKTTTELCYDMRMQWGALRRIEEGQTNFGVDSMIRYIQMLGYNIQLVSLKDVYGITQYQDVVDWMREARKGLYSQRTIAHEIGCSHVNIAKIETKKSIMSIDTFLRLTDLLGYTIKLETNEQDS